MAFRFRQLKRDFFALRSDHAGSKNRSGNFTVMGRVTAAKQTSTGNSE
jgi:hypothetical protein